MDQGRGAVDTTGATPVTINNSLIRAAYGTTILSARNQAASSDIPLVQLQTIGSTNNVMSFTPPRSVTGSYPGNGWNFGNQSFVNNAGGGVASYTVQAPDGNGISLILPGIAAFDALKFYRINGTSSAFT